MPRLFSELPFRSILLVSVLLIALVSLFGNLNARADEGSMVCKIAGGGDCVNEGCHNSLANGQGFTVCLYSGTNCPRLNQCEAGPPSGD